MPDPPRIAVPLDDPMAYRQMEGMTQRKQGLSDPQRAQIAWGRYRRLMLWMLCVSVAAVIVAIFYLKAQGGPFPIHMMIATIAGVGFSMLLASALMGLVFLSSGSGHDEDAADSKRDER
jgi:hypothetical protein